MPRVPETPPCMCAVTVRCLLTADACPPPPRPTPSIHSTSPGGRQQQQHARSPGVITAGVCGVNPGPQAASADPSICASSHHFIPCMLSQVHSTAECRNTSLGPLPPWHTHSIGPDGSRAAAAGITPGVAHWVAHWVSCYCPPRTPHSDCYSSSRPCHMSLTATL